MMAFKLSGAGNDFIALVEPEMLPTAESIRAWCRRGLSLGADGVFTIDRLDRTRVRMRYFNADGGRSDLCLNGTRCAARLAIHLGWSDRAGRLTLDTDAGSLSAHDEGEHRISLELPHFDARPRTLVVDRADGSLEGWRLDVGVPHFVLPWPGMSSAPVASLGGELRSHPTMGEDGANVSFVDVRDPRTFEIRTFERGVEAETLACGTGIVASALALERAGLLERLGEARALTKGGSWLWVSREERELRLTGDARLVASCELQPGASAAVDPPSWRR